MSGISSSRTFLNASAHCLATRAEKPAQKAGHVQLSRPWQASTKHNVASASLFPVQLSSAFHHLIQYALHGIQHKRYNTSRARLTPQHTMNSVTRQYAKPYHMHAQVVDTHMNKPQQQHKHASNSMLKRHINHHLKRASSLRARSLCSSTCENIFFGEHPERQNILNNHGDHQHDNRHVSAQNISATIDHRGHAERRTGTSS